MAKYLWMKQMTSKMAALKAAGQPLPTSIEDVEQKLGECAALDITTKYTAVVLPTLLLFGNLESSGTDPRRYLAGFQGA